MKYNSLDVASFIAQFCIKNKFSFNNTKIQKLLYCCYGCVLAQYDDRICDEYPRAWQYGPVFPRVFTYIYKKNDIVKRESALEDAPEDLKDFIEEVVKIFGKYSATSLSGWTHKEGSPWDTVVNKMGEGLNNFIPDDIIKEYFKKNVVNNVANKS